MDVREFAALKEGDVIENHMGGSFGAGTVTAVEKMGVRVRWGESSPNAPTFFYSVQGTAWFHWSRAEPPMTAERAEELTKRAM